MLIRRVLRGPGLTLVLLLLAACNAMDRESMTCRMDGSPENVAARPSPFDSIAIMDSSTVLAKLCYSRPLARGREIMGGLVPYDTLWRTGANEPTIIHLSRPAAIAGMHVEPGDYSLYTIPSEDQWLVVVNASTSQWGLTQDVLGPNGSVFPNAYTDEVRAQEIGRAPIEVQSIPFTEQLTASLQGLDETTYRLRFDWETTRIVVPIEFTPPTS